MPYFTRDTELDSVTLSYLKRGKLGDAVFLIHGLGMGKDAWLFQMRPIAKAGFIVYAHDSRGFGKSTMTEFPDDEKKALEFYSIEKDVEDLLALMDHLEIDKGHLIGISIGGLITQMFTVLHPERVISATIANSFSSEHGRIAYAGESWLRAAEKMSFAGVFDIMLPMIVGEKMLESPVFATVVSQMKKMYVATNSNWCFITKIKAIKAQTPESFQERIKEIKVPVLLIGGSDDILTPPKYQEYTKSLIPHAELVIIPDVGHASILDNSDAFNATVITFLKNYRIIKDG